MKEKRTRIRRKNAGYKKMMLILIIIFILILIITKIIFPATVSLSKYVYSIARGVYLNSKEFYFTSNILGKENNKYEVTNWNGKDWYTVSVNMYSRKNFLKKVTADTYDEETKVSNMDIEYEISVIATAYREQSAEPLADPIILNKDTPTELTNEYIRVKVDKLKSKIFAILENDSFKIEVKPINEEFFNNKDYVKLVITANAISPYTDEIKGEYIITVGKEGFSYKIEDSANSPYVNVILTNASSDDENKLFYLEFNPEDIVLDTTSSEYLTAQGNPEWLGKNEDEYFNKIKIQLGPFESKFVKFYKKDSTKDYSYPNGSAERVVTIKDESGEII